MTSPSTEQLADLLRRLADGIIRLGQFVSETPDERRWRRRTGDDWSAHDVLVHLRASNEILTPRVMRSYSARRSKRPTRNRFKDVDLDPAGDAEFVVAKSMRGAV